MQTIEELWQTYYPRLRVYGRSFAGLDDCDIEDCIQEIFLRIFRQRERYDTRWALSTWVYRIARNCFIDFQRSRRRAEGRTSTESGELELPAPDRRVEADARLDISRALGELSDIQREIFHCYYAEDMNIAQIALLMSLREGTVKSHLARGRKRLANDLEDAYGRQ